MERELIRKRALSRRFVMQVLYRWCLTSEDPQKITLDFKNDEDFADIDQKHFSTLVQQCVQQKKETERLVETCIEFPLSEVDPIEQVLIRSAISEIACFQETDKAVIISEAVRLAKKFGSEEGYRFVNGVLDKLKDKL